MPSFYPHLKTIGQLFLPAPTYLMLFHLNETSASSPGVPLARQNT